MKKSADLVVRGALLGALVGAVGGWAYGRYAGKDNLPAKAEGEAAELDWHRILSLAALVFRAVRQLADTA